MKFTFKQKELFILLSVNTILSVLLFPVLGWIGISVLFALLTLHSFCKMYHYNFVHRGCKEIQKNNKNNTNFTILITGIFESDASIPCGSLYITKYELSRVRIDDLFPLSTGFQIIFEEAINIPTVKYGDLLSLIEARDWMSRLLQVTDVPSVKFWYMTINPNTKEFSIREIVNCPSSYFEFMLASDKDLAQVKEQEFNICTSELASLDKPNLKK